MLEGLWQRWLWWRRSRQTSGVKVIYYNAFLRSLAESLIGIFIPVYIFLVGQEVWGLWVSGVKLVAIYVVVERLVMIIGSISVARIVGRVGFLSSGLIATGLQVMGLVVLMKVDEDWRWLLVAGVIFGFVIMFYWLARLAVFATAGERESFGRKVSVTALVERGAGVIGPVIGGVVAMWWGFDVLFALGVFVLILSCVPMLWLGKQEKDGDVSWKGLCEWLGKRDNLWYNVGFIGRAMDDVVAVVWPVFVFLIVGGLAGLGAIISGVMLISVFMTYVVGKWFDRRRSIGGMEDERLYWVGTILTSIARVIRGLARTTGGVLILDSIDKIVAPFYWVPFDSYQFSAAKRLAPLQFFAYREVIYSFGRLMMAVLVWMVIGWDGGWFWVFGIGAVGVLLSLGMAVESNK